jgi:hypothetical protein
MNHMDHNYPGRTRGTSEPFRHFPSHTVVDPQGAQPVSKPNQRAEQAGYRLQAIIAPNITAALEHIGRELSVLDGWPERGDSVPVSASAELTSVERAANARFELTGAREDLRDKLDDAMAAIDSLQWHVQLILRMRVPRDVKGIAKPSTLCRDGITDATRAGSLEWHDPTCMMPAVKKGLCQIHYDARRYWCKTHGVDTSNEYEPGQVEGAA